MKTLELKLKKDVLIVDLQEGYEFTAIGNDKEIYYAIKLDENYTKISNGKEWRFICKGSELTEEIASELVEYWQNMANDGFIYENYKTNLPKKKTAVESVISAVESKGFYWLENPAKYERNGSEIYADKNKLSRYISKEEIASFKAEEKTFRNHLIFVKK